MAKISGLPENAVEKVPDARNTIRNLLLFAIGANDKHPIPQKSMAINKFFDWYLGEYEKCGCRLKGLDLSKPIDWTT
eukprot:8527221-Lingulodinium_polyedra.AAC.1